MSRNFIAVLVVVVAGMIGIFAFAGDDSSSGDSVANIADPRTTQEDDRVKGENASKVTLIEYADFGCPGCGGLHPLLTQLQAEFDSEMEVVFRHFPLIDLHPNAMAAHRAAEAAGLQDKFWEMHDLLFERQAEWVFQTGNSQAQAIALFESYASELQLDIDKYNSDVASDEVFNVITKHSESASSLGLTGTPSLLLNGEELATPRSYEELRSVVEEAIANSSTDASAETEATEEDAPAEAAN